MYDFFAKRLFILATVSVILILLSQLLGRYVWQLELFSHFVPFYALVLLLAGIVYPKTVYPSMIDSKQVVNKWRMISTRVIRAMFLIIGVALLIWCLPSYYLFKQWYSIPNMQDNSMQYNINRQSLAYQNVNISNTKKADTLAQLLTHQPDILVLLEAGGDWSAELQTLHKNYPIHCGDDQFSPFAMQVFIKNKAVNNTTESSCRFVSLDSVPSDIPLIKLMLSSQQIVYVMHPPPPINAELAKIRKAYLQGLRQYILQDRITHSTAQISVIGDMNSTAFSPVYRDFISETGLQSTLSAGMPTWLPFMIGIDHYLIGNPKQTNSHMQVTPLSWVGSDHRGLLVDGYYQ